MMVATAPVSTAHRLPMQGVDTIEPLVELLVAPMLLLLLPAARRQRRRLLSPSGGKGRGEEAPLEERYRTGRPHLPFAVCAVGATRHVRCADAVAGLDRRRSCRMWRPMQGSRYCASSSSYAC